MMNFELTEEEHAFIRERVKALETEMKRIAVENPSAVAKDLVGYLSVCAADIAHHTVEKLYREKGKEFCRRYGVAVLEKMLEL